MAFLTSPPNVTPLATVEELYALEQFDFDVKNKYVWFITIFSRSQEQMILLQK